MHSALNRLQQAFGFFTSVAFAIATAVALSVLLVPQTPSASLELRNVQVVKGRPHYYSTRREEYAHVKFDLDADLTTLFNWNTKQVFLYITASYPSSDPSSVPASEAVIWDAIIPSALAPRHPNTWIHPTSKKSNSKPTSKKARAAAAAAAAAGKAFPAGGSPGIVRLNDQKPKYQITDVSGKMAERGNATLQLHWNVQPWVGALVWDARATVGRWEALKEVKGPVQFDFPPLKSAEVKKEDLKTAKGGERNRGKPA